jgi:single-stranded-DNA-specific exonuclease
MADICNLEEIQKILEKAANQKLKKEDIAPFLNIDAEVEADEVNWEVFKEIERFQPFGNNNIAPLFVMRRLKIIGMKNVGSKENHLKLYLEKETKRGVKKFSAIGFNLVNSCAKIDLNDEIDIVFEILANEWNNTKELQLKIVDLKKI